MSSQALGTGRFLWHMATFRPWIYFTVTVLWTAFCCARLLPGLVAQQAFDSLQRGTAEPSTIVWIAAAFVGTGVAGYSAALAAASAGARVLAVAKGDLDASNTGWAQGGVRRSQLGGGEHREGGKRRGGHGGGDSDRAGGDGETSGAGHGQPPGHLRRPTRHVHHLARALTGGPPGEQAEHHQPGRGLEGRVAQLILGLAAGGAVDQVPLDPVAIGSRKGSLDHVGDGQPHLLAEEGNAAPAGHQLDEGAPEALARPAIPEAGDGDRHIEGLADLLVGAVLEGPHGQGEAIVLGE